MTKRNKILVNRLKSGKIYDNNLKIYSNEFLKEILLSLENEEDYESCSIINKVIKNRNNHLNNFKNPLL